MSLSDELDEQLHREWQADPSSSAVWEAMSAIKRGQAGGRHKLLELGESGSNIAQIYLGKYFLHGYYEFEKDVEAGLRWLEKASHSGSIEAKFGLAQQLFYLGKLEESKRLYRELADIDYAAAQYRLANIFLKEKGRVRNIEAKLLLESAEKNGNLHAANKLANLYLTFSFGALLWPKGFVKKLRIAVPFLKAGIREPKSERFRR